VGGSDQWRCEVNGVKPECLGDGVCTNPRCERHGMNTPVVTDEAVEKLARTYYENLGWDWDDLDTDLKDHDENKATILREFRAALEAAAPLLGTRPQPDEIRDPIAGLDYMSDSSPVPARPQPTLDAEAARAALTTAFLGFRERSGGCPEGPDCAACRRLAGDEAEVALGALARLVSSRPALERYFSNGGPDTPIRTTWHDGVEHWEAPASDIRALIDENAVEAAVRPLPTREQIAEALLVELKRQGADEFFYPGKLADDLAAVTSRLFTGGKE
jgi:hypothetical protein